MTEPKTISLEDLITCVSNGDQIEPDPNSDLGHVLTVEHYGRNPTDDLRRNYIDLLYEALGDDRRFGRYSIRIESHATVITRNDVPVSEFGSRRMMESQAESNRHSPAQRSVFETAAVDTGQTLREIAEEEGRSIEFVRRTLQLE